MATELKAQEKKVVEEKAQEEKNEWDETLEHHSLWPKLTDAETKAQIRQINVSVWTFRIHRGARSRCAPPHNHEFLIEEGSEFHMT